MVKYSCIFFLCLVTLPSVPTVAANVRLLPDPITLDLTFTLEQLYLPLDGTHLTTNTSPIADSTLTVLFPLRPIWIAAPFRQNSTKATQLDAGQYGLLQGAFPWLYDLEKSPTGITILFYFYIPVKATGPVYLLSTDSKRGDPQNSAGFNFHVNSETGNLETRFGYETYDYKCICGAASGSVGVWHAVHASCRNYHGLLQCSMAVDGDNCEAKLEGRTCDIVERTPNYDASQIDTLYIGGVNSSSVVALDELRIFNSFTEFDPIKRKNDETETKVIVLNSDKCCLGQDIYPLTCPNWQIRAFHQLTTTWNVAADCLDDDECARQPCSDSCLNQQNGFQCSCPNGQSLLPDNLTCRDACTGVTCQLNTQCYPTADENFQCACSSVTRGSLCENTVDLCSSSSCLNGGSCVMAGSQRFCVCGVKYVGENCQEEITDCARKPCRHGGTCVLTDDDIGFKCICKVDYSGTVCESFNVATAIKCAHDGVYSVVNDEAFCVCTGDWKGARCDESAHPCNPNPCLHGGTCAVDGLHPKCECLPGFSGAECDKDIDECLLTSRFGKPCSVNASCVNTIGSYICACPLGYGLPNCTDRLNLCTSNPCENGGICTNGIGLYTCTCPPDYLGQNCEVMGADRMTVTSSEKRLVAGKFVTYIVQCAKMGQEPTFYFSMGDRLYFYLTNATKSSLPVWQTDASHFILKQTSVEITLQNPPDRYVFFYKHFFSAPGAYALSVQVFNKNYPSAKYITVVHVEKHPSDCFPAVSIVNGGVNISNGPPFQKSSSFVIQSVVTISPDCKVANKKYAWTVYRLTPELPISLPENIQELESSSILTNRSYLEIPARFLPYGSYMNELKITVITVSGKTLVNLDRGWFNITATPLRMRIKGGAKHTVGNNLPLALDGSESTDPDEKASAMTYYWFGYTGHAAADQPPEDIATAILSTACISSNFPTCTGFFSDSKGKTVIEVPPVVSAAPYRFRLVGEVLRADKDSANLHHSETWQIVTVTDGTYPNIELRCTKTNCADSIDAGERFSLEVVCENCPNGSTYLWSVTSSTDANLTDFIWTDAEGMEFNKTEKLLAVKEEFLSNETFDPKALYTFSVTVTQPDGISSQAEYSVRVNEPPVIGSCTVDPPEGYGLETYFTVECKDWSDNDLPLTYRFHYKNGDEVIANESSHSGDIVHGSNSSTYDKHGQKGTLLYYNVDPRMPDTLLPNGLQENNYTGELFVIVHDAFDVMRQLVLLVTVKPRMKTAAEVTQQFEDLMSDGGNFQRSINSGNHQGTAQTAVAISTQLNHMSEAGKEEPGLSLNKKKEIRQELMEALDDLPIHSLSALQQVAASVTQVAGRPAEINEKAQEKSANLLAILGKKLEEKLNDKTGPFELQETAAYIVSAVTNVLNAVASRVTTYNATLADTTTTLAAVKEDSSRLIGVIKNIMDSYGTTKLVGEGATKFITPELQVGVSEHYPVDVSRQLNEGMMKNYLQLPAVVGDLGEEPVQVQTLFSQNNLYPWDPSAASINTPNIQLSFKNPKAGVDVSVTNLKEPIHIVLPLKDGTSSADLQKEHERSTVAMPAKYYSSMNMSVDNVTVPLGKTLVVRIVTQNLEVPLHILISQGSKPSLEHNATVEDIGMISPFKSNLTKEFYFNTLIPSTADDVTYYVAVAAGDLPAYRDRTVTKSVDNPPDGSVTTVTFNITMFSAVCLYWHETKESWQSDGCKVSNLTTREMLHCDCYHLTTFGAGLFVQPNQIDLINDWSLFTTFFENPLVVSIVIAIWVLYFSLLVYARKLDIVEEAKRGVHVLTDNDAAHQYYYVVTVCTGLRLGAATTAKVGIVLKGMSDQSDPHILNEVPGMEFFETGGEDSFLVAVPDSLGDLMALSIWQNGEGTNSAWYVDELLVRDIQTNQLFFFLPNRWLAANKADGLLSVEVPVASPEVLTSFWHRFTSFTSRGLRDSHLWFSVLYRPPRSTFTRAQRLTCIVSMLLTTMMASIMFYRVIDPTPKDQISFQGFTFNMQQIVVSIQSGLIALPGSVLVIQCFVNAKPRKEKKKVEQEDLPKGHGLPGQLSKTFLDPAVTRLMTSEGKTHVFRKQPNRDRVEDSAFISHAVQKFPFWTIYVAWTIAITSAVISSIFVCLYGLKFGRTQSLEWTVAFFSAILQDVVIVQPLKVLAMSCLVAMVLMKPVVRESEGSVDAYPDLSSGFEVRQTACYQPPSPEWVAAVRRIAVLTKQMNQWLVDIGWFVVFMVSILVFTYGNTPIGGYAVRSALEKTFKIPLGSKGFMDVKDVKGMWSYLNKPFLEALHPNRSLVDRLSLAAKAGHYTADMVNIAMGPARLRQVRIRRDNCLRDERVEQLEMNCLPAYSILLHETRTFDAGWVFPNISSTNSTAIVLDSGEAIPFADESEVDYSSAEEEKMVLNFSTVYEPWKYETSVNIGMGIFTGDLAIYRGGGYIAVLPHTASNTSDMLKQLQNDGWVDDLTRAVFVQMNNYNPNVNLFTIVILVFEFHQSGLIVPFYTINTIRLFTSDKNAYRLTMGFGLFSTFLLVTFTVNIFRQIISRRLKYFRDGWNWLDIFIVLIGWTTFALYFISTRSKSAAMNLITKADQDHFVGFYFAMMAEAAFIDMAAFCFFICTIKLLKILRITRKINTLLYVLTDMSIPLLGFCFSFFISIVPFIIAGHVIFGRILKRNSSFYTSFISIMRLMVADVEELYTEYVKADFFFGPLYFTAAAVSVIYIYTNMLMALIMVIYSRTIAEHQKKIETDAELSDFVVEKLRGLFGMHVDRPVVDLTKFPTAIELRDLSDVYRMFDHKPDSIDPNDWGNFLNMTELRKLAFQVVDNIRPVQPEKHPARGFRTDYASHTDDWYYLQTMPSAVVQGAATNPVNKLTSAKAIMKGSQDAEQYENEHALDVYNSKHIELYRDMLVTTKLSVILINMPGKKTKKRHGKSSSKKQRTSSRKEGRKKAVFRN